MGDRQVTRQQAEPDSDGTDDGALIDRIHSAHGGCQDIAVQGQDAEVRLHCHQPHLDAPGAATVVQAQDLHLASAVRLQSVTAFVESDVVLPVDDAEHLPLTAASLNCSPVISPAQRSSTAIWSREPTVEANSTPELKVRSGRPVRPAACKAGSTLSGSASVEAIAATPSATHSESAAACSSPFG